MPDYVWRAATAAGKVEEGRLSAPSSAAALKQLRDQGLTPLRIDDAATAAAAGVSVGAANEGSGGLAPSKTRQAKGSVNAADVMALTSELAIMLRAGLALDNALRVLIDMSHKPSVAALVQGILDGVDDIAFCRLTNHDVVRHKLVGRIVAAYDRYDSTLAEAFTSRGQRGNR